MRPRIDDARSFDREVVGVAGAGEPIDRDAGDALQRFGDGAVGKCADVLRRDRIDDRVGVALDVL